LCATGLPCGSSARALMTMRRLATLLIVLSFSVAPLTSVADALIPIYYPKTYVSLGRAERGNLVSAACQKPPEMAGQVQTVYRDSSREPDQTNAEVLCFPSAVEGEVSPAYSAHCAISSGAWECNRASNYRLVQINRTRAFMYVSDHYLYMNSADPQYKDRIQIYESELARDLTGLSILLHIKSPAARRFHGWMQNKTCVVDDWKTVLVLPENQWVIRCFREASTKHEYTYREVRVTKVCDSAGCRSELGREVAMPR
jgi:hypothetical protein